MIQTLVVALILCASGVSASHADPPTREKLIESYLFETGQASKRASGGISK